MNRFALVLASATLAACSTTPSSSNDNKGIDTLVPSTTAADSPHMVLPSLNGAMPHLQSGEITLTGDTGAGTATFTQAASWSDDATAPPSTFGTGSFSVTLGSNVYASSTVQSMFATLPDDAGNAYLVVGAMAQDATTNRIQVVYAVVKQSDFAAGADVALDGVDRYALYVAGSADTDAPDTLAVATTGTVHFAATATLTGPLDATLDATFAAADASALEPDPSDPSGPRDPGDPGSPDGGTTATPPAAGPYALHFGAASAECVGTLTGKEADFAAVAASSLGFVDMSVTLAVSADQVTMTGGAPLANAFGSDPIVLTQGDASAPFWQYAAAKSGSAGPDGTTLGYTLFGLDASSSPYAANAAAVFFLGDGRDDYCAIGFDVTMTP